MEANELDMNFEEFNQILKLFSLCKSEYFTIKYLLSRISILKISKKTKQAKNSNTLNSSITFQEPISQDLVFFNNAKQLRASLIIMLHREQIKSFNILRQGNIDFTGRHKQGILQINSEAAHLILTNSSFAHSTSLNHEWKQKEFDMLLVTIFEKSSNKFSFEELLEIIDIEVYGKNDKKPMLSFSNYFTLNIIVKVLLIFTAYIDDLIRIIQIVNKDGSGVLKTQRLLNIILGLTDDLNNSNEYKSGNLELEIFSALGVRIGTITKPCLVIREVVDGFIRDISKSILME